MIAAILAAALVSQALAINPGFGAPDDDYGGWFLDGTAWPVWQNAPSVPPVPAPGAAPAPRTDGVLRDNEPALMLKLDGHTSPVRSARFSPDGKRVVTASWDGTASLWDADTGAKLWSTPAPANPREKGLQTALFSPDGTLVATAGQDKTARLWDGASGELRAALSGHAAQIDVVAFSGDGRRVITGARDGTARVWETASGASLRNLVVDPSGSVSAAALDADGARALTGTRKGVAKLWDFRKASATYLAVEPPPSFGSNPVGWLGFIENGAKVVSAQETIRVLDAATGALERGFGEPKGDIIAVSLDASGRKLSAVARSKVTVYDVATGAVRVSAPAMRASYGAALSPDGARIVLANSLWAHIWRIDTLPEEREAIRRALEQTVTPAPPTNDPGSARNRFRRNFGGR